MQKDTPPGTYYTDDKYRRLARWLQDVMAPPQEREAQAGALQGEEAPHFAIPPGEYHPHFYQQLPDFIMALLKYDWQAVSRYAPLLYHLVGCPTCHAGYLDLYDALREAVSVDDDQPHVSLPAQVNVPAARHLVQLCQLLITQAEAVLKQARHEHRDDAALARALLRLAIKSGARIDQSSMRSRALQDLVRVAASAEEGTQEEPPALYSYSPSLAGVGGARHGKTVRKAAAPHPAGPSHEYPAIQLQDRSFTGTITQQEDTLILHLYGLDSSLRGQLVNISVPLGSLIEPIQWLGGNPRAIRSTVAVDGQGALTIPLGRTGLRLDDPKDRPLLEVTFMRVEIHPVR
ncbi:MAG TPA: hypothetical protein VKV40_19455 [Ktedonobacteraceae bacterium]|nr:hypothetical protein [Ktedonobacteraceae bacterium]